MRLVAILLLLAASEARAEVRRYALLLGNNVGAADEAELAYAEQDATRLQTVLTELGAFEPPDVLMLAGADASSARQALMALNERIGREDREAMLIVYYSGHADASALHMGDSSFSLEELEQLVRGSAATYRMLVLDACRSGALTRVKGGEAVAPFQIQLDERLAAEGVVFLTSASANEDAQESDEIEGSFFTHYLVSALLGAADKNDDDRVGLREAYEYAYQNTLRASSRTLVGPQHPTFNWEVRGRGDITLTHLAAGRSRRGVLRLPKGRSYLLFSRDADGPVVAEVAAEDRSRRLSVKAGRYFLRGRGRTHLVEGTVQVNAGQQVDVESAPLAHSRYARLVRKGADTAMVHGPELSLQTRTPLSGLGTFCHGAELAWVFDLRLLSVAPLFSGCAGAGGEPRLGRTDELNAGLRLSRAWDLPLVTLEVGLAGGGALLRQSLLNVRRSASAGWIGANVGLSLEIGLGFVAGVAGGPLVYFAELSSERGTVLRGLFAGRVGLRIGKRF